MGTFGGFRQYPSWSVGLTDESSGEGKMVGGLLEERAKTHGDYRFTALIAQGLKREMRAHVGWGELSPAQQESLDMMATKIGRILSGDANCKDHWADIAGYATLVAERCK